MHSWLVCSAMGVLVWAHAAELDTLHCCRCRGVPLRLLWRLRLRLRLLLQWRQHVISGSWCAALLLCKHACHASIYVRIVRIKTAQRGPHSRKLVLEKLVVLLCSTRIVCFGSQPCILGSSGIVRSTKVLDIFDGFPSVSIVDRRSVEGAYTW